ncbi:alpha/beta fold hydrolase [Malaciobacter molluscorum]|uniref:alpha/beta fold hydrolase n=1 Tax=Malaciobacter molluscorum TaxID=1032072 RepID=UPI0022487773|nr:alpha/beta hydrolase [Malaciobacter molluscorum]
MVFILHELMGDCRNYEPCISYLNTKEYKYFFIDLRGYGLSKDILGNYNCNEAVNDILNLIKENALKKITLIGHSMSSLIVQKFAIDYQEYLKKIILITPVLASGVKIKEEDKQNLLNDMQNDNKIEDIVKAANKRYNQTWNDYRIKLAYSSSTLEARVNYMKMYLEEDFSNEASNIKIPVKVIVGKYDFPVFSKIVIKKEFQKWYKDLEIFEIEDAGHYPMVETPVLFASKIEEFCK